LKDFVQQIKLFKDQTLCGSKLAHIFSILITFTNCKRDGFMATIVATIRTEFASGFAHQL
jgi:hypothetical protein